MAAFISLELEIDIKFGVNFIYLQTYLGLIFSM